MKRPTNKKKFRSSLLAMKQWLRKKRFGNLSEFLETLRRKQQGYWNYYGVLGKYQREVNLLLFKWLNRRIQRRSMTWEQFGRRQPGWQLPPPRIVEKPLNS